MNQKNLSALLTLLKDPDEDAFQDIVNSLTLDEEIISTLENLWQQADDQLAISRLDWMIGRARLNKLTKQFSDWQKKSGGVLEGAWLVARYQYPELQFEEIDNFVSDIAKRVWLELHDKMTPHEQVTAINKVLFGKYGMKSDKISRASIDNMLINNVLDNGKANHLGMLILYLAIAQKLFLPLYIVTLFRALRIAYVDDSTDSINAGNILFYIEPFERGLIFNHDIAKLTITTQGVPFNPIYIQICTDEIIIRGLMYEVQHLYYEMKQNSKVEDMNELIESFSKFDV